MTASHSNSAFFVYLFWLSIYVRIEKQLKKNLILICIIFSYLILTIMRGYNKNIEKMFLQVLFDVAQFFFIFKGSKHLKVLFHTTPPEFLGWGCPIFPYSPMILSSLFIHHPVGLFEVHTICLRHPLNHSLLPPCPPSHLNAYQFWVP